MGHVCEIPPRERPRFSRRVAAVLHVGACHRKVRLLLQWGRLLRTSCRPTPSALGDELSQCNGSNHGTCAPHSALRGYHVVHHFRTRTPSPSHCFKNEHCWPTYRVGVSTLRLQPCLRRAVSVTPTYSALRGADRISSLSGRTSTDWRLPGGEGAAQ